MNRNGVQKRASRRNADDGESVRSRRRRIEKAAALRSSRRDRREALVPAAPSGCGKVPVPVTVEGLVVLDLTRPRQRAEALSEREEGLQV